MAEARTSLRDYQANILNRLEQARTSDVIESSGHLGVVLADQHVLISMEEITETLPLMDIYTVPLVKPWFVGMANVRGVLYAINDLGQLLFDTKADLTAQSRVILLSNDVATHVGFTVDRLIGLRNIKSMQSVEAKKNKTAGLKRKQYEDENKQLWHLVDFEKLVQSPTFIASS